MVRVRGALKSTPLYMNGPDAPQYHSMAKGKATQGKAEAEVEGERYCRYCKQTLAVGNFFSGSKVKRYVCKEHMRSVYRMKHTVPCGGTIPVEHFRLLKNAYQALLRDARVVFKGHRARLHLQDLAPLISATAQPNTMWCVPVDPTQGISPTNVRVLASLEQRKALLLVWECTHRADIYASTLACF